LEKIRDNNLVAMLRALKWQNWGAGQHLLEHDLRLVFQSKKLSQGSQESPEAQATKAIQAEQESKEDYSQPIETVSRAIPLDWTDYNGHMTEARYLDIFGEATDRFMKIIGCDAEYIDNGRSYFTAETHIRHINEVKEATRVRIVTQCLLGEGKKMHLFHQLHHEDGRLLATGEHMLIHVSLESRSSSPPSATIAEKLGKIAALHAQLPLPEGVGAAVGSR